MQSIAISATAGIRRCKETVVLRGGIATRRLWGADASVIVRIGSSHTRFRFQLRSMATRCGLHPMTQHRGGVSDTICAYFWNRIPRLRLASSKRAALLKRDSTVLPGTATLAAWTLISVAGGL